MTNKTRIYNTGKAVTRNELNCLIQDAEDSNDWSKVEQANVSEITDMFYLFGGVKGIKDLNLDEWDTSNVVNMSGMFYGTNYNHPLYFNTSNVTDMAYMFSNSKYNHPLYLDTSNVNNMDGMFRGSKYNHPLTLDTSKVINIGNIFDNASITHPISFNGGNIPDDVQAFIDENNKVYEEKCKLEGTIHNEGDNKTIVLSSFKL